MFKSIILISLLGLALASPIDTGSDYVNTVKQLFEYDSNASPACKQETEKLKYCFKGVFNESTQVSQTSSMPSREEIFESVKDVRTALACTGEVTCSKSKLSKYLIETAVYAVEHIYGEGFECVDENRLQFSMMICMMKNIQQQDISSGNFDPSSIKMKPVARCVSEEQECKASAKQAFLKGAMAFADLTEISMKLAKAVQTENMHFVDTFGKKFDSKEFDNLTL